MEYDYVVVRAGGAGAVLANRRESGHTMRADSQVVAIPFALGLLSGLDVAEYDEETAAQAVAIGWLAADAIRSTS